MGRNSSVAPSLTATRLPDASVLGAPYEQALTIAIRERHSRLNEALAQLCLCAPTLAEVAARMVGVLRGGRKVLIVGNGGSAAEAQHFAGELVGRFRRERAPYAVMALTTDTAILTAIANDYGYQEVFARQVHALGQPGDLLLIFSTSGESENLVRAASAARQCGMATVAVVGTGPCRLAQLATVVVHAPATEAPLVQELHQIVTHLLCEVIEAELAQQEGCAIPPVSSSHQAASGEQEGDV